MMKDQFEGLKVAMMCHRIQDLDLPACKNHENVLRKIDQQVMVATCAIWQELLVLTCFVLIVSIYLSQNQTSICMPRADIIA
jgi:hypothetical protein